MSSEYDVFFPEKDVKILGDKYITMRPLPISKLGDLAEVFSGVIGAILVTFANAQDVEVEKVVAAEDENGVPMMGEDGNPVTKTVVEIEKKIPKEAISELVSVLISNHLSATLKLLNHCIVTKGVTIDNLPSTALADMVSMFVELNLNEEVISRFLSLAKRLSMTYTTVKILSAQRGD